MTIVLIVTFLPVFTISFGQAYARLAQDRSVVARKLADAVSLSQEQGKHVLDTASETLNRLGLRDDVLKAAPSCRQTLDVALLALPNVINIVRVNATGSVTCSARPIIVSPDMREHPWWKKLSTTPEITYFGPTIGRASQKSVLIMGHAVKDSGGRPDGHVVLNVDLEKLERNLQQRMLQQDARLALVDQSGTQIHASTPRLGPRFASGVTIKFTDVSQESIAAARGDDGRLWSYSVAPLIADQVFLMYAMPDDILFSSTLRHVATDIALPLIALLLTGAGLWMAIQYIVVRPVERLQDLAKSYAVGKFETRTPQFAYGPKELIDLREDLATMAGRAQIRDFRLKRTNDHKDALVKELHHRVKNNLQMVLSLISLQARQVVNLESRTPFDRLHARIAAMALVQNLIVEKNDHDVIDACSLIEIVTAQLQRSNPIECARLGIEIECEPLALVKEKALPFALFVLEGVTNALEHGFVESASGHIIVKFETLAGNQAKLSIGDTGKGWAPGSAVTGTGQQLLAAFARQLGGQLTVEPTPTYPTLICVQFGV